jgi:hypothetical protein
MFNFIDICSFSTRVVAWVGIPVHSFSQGPIMLLRRSCRWGLCCPIVLFCRSLFVLLSFGHCVVCPSWIYGFRFLLWYLQTFLAHWILEYTFINVNVDIKNILCTKALNRLFVFKADLKRKYFWLNQLIFNIKGCWL